MRKPPHLLRVAEPAAAFGELAAALAAAGLRFGWLELPPPEPPPEPPPALAAATELGALRAVAVGGDRIVAAKRLRGAPVLGDLLREHFRGCAVVLVRGEIVAPHLTRRGKLWRLEPPARDLTTAALIAALRKPRLLQPSHPPEHRSDEEADA